MENHNLRAVSCSTWGGVIRQTVPAFLPARGPLTAHH